jgi:hypothetical protein
MSLNIICPNCKNDHFHIATNTPQPFIRITCANPKCARVYEIVTYGHIDSIREVKKRSKKR